jgi:PAS domain S-box-containing protein
MNDDVKNPNEKILDTPNLADALESSRFKQFLDHVPFGVAVAELDPTERIVYVNLEFERLIGMKSSELENRDWNALPELRSESRDSFVDSIRKDEEHVGVFRGGDLGPFDAWSNLIADDEGAPVYRLVAIAAERRQAGSIAGLQEKDTLLRELQHRVKNNLQMITALIRMEVRNTTDENATSSFHRLAGRVESLALLYDALMQHEAASVDLGIYLTEIATAVMRAHASEGIRLDMKVDTWPVSIDVAMPTGLVVNELLTNSLKHAFESGSGTITLRCVVENGECRVVVADDGKGLPEGEVWPKPGKLSSLIVQSLRQNAKAMVKVESATHQGVRVTIYFSKASAEAPGV